MHDGVVRPLSALEIAWGSSLFGDQVDFAPITIIARPFPPIAWLPDPPILVRWNRIYWPRGACLDFTQASAPSQAVLVHEWVHVWQYQTGRFDLLRYFARLSPMNYHYTLPLPGFLELGYEQQAALFEDLWRLHRGLPPRWHRNADGGLPRYRDLIACIAAVFPKVLETLPSTEAPTAY